VVRPLEQVRVGGKGDGRVGVSELARDEDDVQALGDQERGKAMPDGVEREPRGPPASPARRMTGDQVQVNVTETLGNPTNTRFKTYVTIS
jgi:hypothetical protein